MPGSLSLLDLKRLSITLLRPHCALAVEIHSPSSHSSTWSRSHILETWKVGTSQEKQHSKCVRTKGGSLVVAFAGLEGCSKIKL